MAKIDIDKEKCIKCYACLKDCVTYSIKKGEDDFPVFEIENNHCVSCQHCFAICPTGAIKFNDKIAQDADSVSFGNSDDVLKLIKSRRSIRQFKNEEIKQEDFEKIKNMLSFVPTGCNFDSLHFSIVESKSAMDLIRNYVNKKILNLISNKFMDKYVGKFKPFKKAFENGEDIIFRNAPSMIVVSSHIHAPCANVDPIIALSYLELYAQSLGLGTCWCGFAQVCFKLLPKLSQMVRIPDKYKPVYVMLIGVPAVKYSRTILADAVNISEIQNVNMVRLNWSEKLRRLLINFIR